MDSRQRRFQFAAGLGIGAWALGTGVLVALIETLYLSGAPASELVAAYPLFVLWFVSGVVGDLSVLGVVIGVAVWVLLCLTGALAALLFEGAPGPRTGVEVGLGVGGGQLLGVTAAVLGAGRVGPTLSAVGVEYVLACGGFAVPAALATIGAVGASALPD